MYIIINIIKKIFGKAKPVKPTIDVKYIVPQKNHEILNKDINANAITVVNRLNQAGFQSYLVGGSVRDLLINRSPKDYDVATSATPQQVRKLFRNARIIGRRFKLIHILYHREIIEVATFRAHEPVNTNLQTNDHGMLIQDNVYGTLEQDAWRRDFTINSLYYHVTDGSIIDYTQGFQDITQKTIRIIGDPSTRYHEDPVRMLRAIRFSAKLEFTIAPDTAAPMKSLSHLITHVSGSRLFDEMIKLYQCGSSSAMQPLLEEHGLFQHLFPATAALMPGPYPVSTFLKLALESTDQRIQINKPVNPAFLFAVILWFPLKTRTKALIKSGIDPIPAFEQAMSQIVSEQNKIVTIPKRHTQVMRDIWLLQSRFLKRHGHRPAQLLQHPRFRAAYDFLALRALAKDAPLDLAQWWTTFQDVDEHEQSLMVAECSHNPQKPG